MKLICATSAESVAMVVRLEITRQEHSAVLFDCLGKVFTGCLIHRFDSEFTVGGLTKWKFLRAVEFALNELDDQGRFLSSDIFWQI